MKKKLVIFTFILTLFGPINAQRLKITTVADSLKAKAFKGFKVIPD